ncbi:MAG: cysteine--tRNA ligase [Nanoarchaeota archaeon]
MILKLFNTLSRKKEVFTPVRKDLVRMYTCGPTVYNYPHIGNYRAYIFEDILRRYLKYKGYTVRQVMNITDVDDKTIKNSHEQHLTLQQYTDRYTKAFFEDLKTLNIEQAEVYPRATGHVQEMIAIIEALLKNGSAYRGEDNCIYYDISTFKKYGKLAHIKVKELKAGARVKQDEYEKEHAADFALWKAWDEKDGTVFWESPFGKGRPGWHIECSAMSMKHLTNAFSGGRFRPEKFETIDIHTGGIDNIFPHHEDEIAQSEGATGKKFVNYWLHNEHLLVDNKKMSKSLGNFFTLHDVLDKGHKPVAVRYILLATHYRKQLNFTFKGLDAAQNSLDRLQDFIRNVQAAQGGHTDIDKILQKAKDDFEAALDDDLNMPHALRAVFELVKKANVLLSAGKINRKNSKDILELLQEFDNILGVLAFAQEKLSKEIEALIQKREEARMKKDFAAADKIRDLLKEKGILLDDTKEGVRWKRMDR